MNVTSLQSEFKFQNLILKIFPPKRQALYHSRGLSVVRLYTLCSRVIYRGCLSLDIGALLIALTD